MRDNPQLGQEEWLEKLREAVAESELGILGFKGTGVYSFGDIAADWQGFRFYQSAISGAKPLMGMAGDGNWYVVNPFDFRDYVTDDFDEVLNPNIYYTDSFTAKVQAEYLKQCELYREAPEKFLSRSGRLIPERYLPLNEDALERRKRQDANRIENLCSH